MTRNRMLAKLRNALVAQCGSWCHTPQRDAATQERIDRWQDRLKARGVSIIFKA